MAPGKDTLHSLWKRIPQCEDIDEDSDIPAIRFQFADAVATISTERQRIFDTQGRYPDCAEIAFLTGFHPEDIMEILALFDDEIPESENHLDS